MDNKPLWCQKVVAIGGSVLCVGISDIGVHVVVVGVDICTVCVGVGDVSVLIVAVGVCVYVDNDNTVGVSCCGCYRYWCCMC